MKKNSKIIVGGSLIIIAILSLLITSIPSFASTEVNLSEILNNPNIYYGEYLTIEGALDESSIKWNADSIELNFRIMDENKNELSVYHKGVRPDNFTNGIIVILQGTFNQNGIFEAEQLLTKCPSKYESVDQSNYETETHKIIDSSK